MAARRAKRDQPKPEYATVGEVATELHISRATALHLIDSGELPAIDVSPTSAFRMRRVPRQALEQFKIRRGINNDD